MNFIFKEASVGLILLLCLATSVAEELPDIGREGAGNTSLNNFNLWVNPGMVSYRFNQDTKHRDLNWGYGIQSNLSDNLSVLGGNFINSKDARSNYAGLAWQPLTWHSVKIGLMVGAVNGYPAIHNGDYFVVAMPWLSIHNELIGVNITIVPNYSNSIHSSAITGQLIMRVW